MSVSNKRKDFSSFEIADLEIEIRETLVGTFFLKTMLHDLFTGTEGRGRGCFPVQIGQKRADTTRGVRRHLSPPHSPSKGENRAVRENRARQSPPTGKANIPYVLTHLRNSNKGVLYFDVEN